MTALAIPDLLGTAPADLIAGDIERPQATETEARARLEEIKAGAPTFVRMLRKISDAYACRDWVALGYATWHEYRDAEFGELLDRAVTAERREAVVELRHKGMSIPQIAAIVRASVGTVHSDLARLSATENLPTTVTGADGKTYAATKPATPEIPAESLPRPALGEAAEPGTSAASPTLTEPERPKPPAWDPEERHQHEEEVRRIQMIEAARRESKTIVTTVLSAVSTVVGGARLGERGLVTREMVAKLREAIDLLEGEIDSED